MNASEIIDTDLLRSFLAVASCGNVTRAAQTLNRTQSAVSLQMKRLEGRLDTTLFRREARGVSLTPAGERLRETALRVITELDSAVSSLREDLVTGSVRVGIPEEYGADVLPQILSGFRVRHPGVEVSVACGYSAGFARAVDHDDLDLAVFADAPGSGDDDERSSDQLLAHDQLVWVGRDRRVLNPDEKLPLALFDRSCFWRDVAIAAMETIGQPFRVVFSSESTAGIKAAISSGLAVGLLGRSAVDGSMRVLDEDLGFPALPASRLVLRQRPGALPAHLAMAEAIKEGFANH